MAVVSRAPSRIDLAGGTLDIWPLSLLHAGAVTVNLAVTVHARAEATERDAGVEIISDDRGLRAVGATARAVAEAEPGLILAARLVERLCPERPVTLRMRAEAPAHAGLGGSSALGIAVAGALDRHAGGSLDRDALLRVVQDVETAVIAVPTGQQDYLAALWGGLQALHWQAGGVVRERLEATGLAERLVLSYTGAPRFSGANNWEVTKRRIDGDPQIIRRLDAIRDAAIELTDALRRADYPAAAAAMRAEWAERRELTPGITTAEIEDQADRARAAGALAFKVCGAGGGGCVAALVEPNHRAAVEAGMIAAGGELLPFATDTEGLVVTA